MKLKDAIQETDKLRANQFPSGRVLKYAMRYIRSNKQLFIQAEVASGTDKNVKYQSRLVFNGIEWSPRRTKTCTVKYKDVDGSLIFLQKPTTDHHVLTRDSCQDFRFCWHWWIADRKALLGPRIPYTRKTTHYPEVNPQHYPGICKHILTLIKKLISVRFLKADSWTINYLNRPKKNPERPTAKTVKRGKK